MADGLEDRSKAASDILEKIPDEVLQAIQFSMPWQYDPALNGRRDEDGFVLASVLDKDDERATREALQEVCWKKFQRNPQINTAVRGLVGRLTGWGFETVSEIPEIQSEIDATYYDPRNRLYNFWPKYVGRAFIEGELFLLLTCHDDGFVEVDFVDPALVGPKGDEDSGIIFHPTKASMPLFYNISDGMGNISKQVPSIFVARYPELVESVSGHSDYDRKYQRDARSRKRIYKRFGGYDRFIVSWDRGFMTRRAVSYLRTTIEWLNHYENLKKYEIDHKKSAGAYLWVFTFTDPRAFKTWLSLSDDERRKTGIMQKKTPGGALVLPPGMDVEVKNPNLSNIREQDTDILQMVASGLNEPEDVMTGTAKGTFATVKASRGPMSDRTSDEIAYFDRFLKFDFWASVFFLKSSINGFKSSYLVEEAVGFDKSKEPIFKKVRKPPEQLVDIIYPISEMIDFESRAKGLLGTKHGPVTETLGVSKEEVLRRMGLGGYGRMRLRKATEDNRYPELVYAVDAESIQERQEGEPKASANKGKSEKNS